MAKDFAVNVRVDEKTIRELDKIADRWKVSRSEVVRQLIEYITGKKTEEAAELSQNVEDLNNHIKDMTSLLEEGSHLLSISSEKYAWMRERYINTNAMTASVVTATEAATKGE